MASTARRYAYPTAGSAARQRQDRAPVRQQPRVNVLEGTREETIRETSLLVTVAKVALIVLIAMTVIAFGRIALTSASVTLGIETDALSAQLTSDRSAAGLLEVQDTALTSNSRIQTAAEELDMSAPYDAEVIYLSEDVVATNSDGSLSLSESMRRASEAGA